MNIEKIKELALKVGSKKLNANNTTGYRGVTFHGKNKKYRATIRINGQKIWIGEFKTAEEASEAYEAVKLEINNK